MIIGIIIGRFPPDVLGGAELQAKQMAQQLAQRGHQVVVFTRRYQGRPYREQQDGYTICRRDELPIPGLRSVWDIFPTVGDIARHRPRPEVLLCYQTLNSGLVGMIAQTVLGIPIVVSVRGNIEYRLKSSLRRRLLVPPVYRRARRITVQSGRVLQDMREQLRLVGLTNLAEAICAKTEIIPNGINLPKVEPSQGQKIIFVGRLIKNKGVADLIEAMKHVTGHELLIVGDGPDRVRLQQLAAGLPITFVGQVAPPVVLDYLKQARVLVLPSHVGDGFPNVVLEAMAGGVPVVATAIAGIPDLVQHGETGYLFEVGNIQQMAAYINQILHDDDLWIKLGQCSSEVVRAYSWDVVTPHVEELLYSLTNSTMSD